jgi:hypothetical protein
MGVNRHMVKERPNKWKLGRSWCGRLISWKTPVGPLHEATCTVCRDRYLNSLKERES